MSKIDRVRIHEFSFEVPDIGLEQASAGVGNMAYVKGSSLTAHRFAVRGHDLANSVTRLPSINGAELQLHC